jgi:hypothetical protein
MCITREVAVADLMWNGPVKCEYGIAVCVGFVLGEAGV